MRVRMRLIRSSVVRNELRMGARMFCSGHGLCSLRGVCERVCVICFMHAEYSLSRRRDLLSSSCIKPL